MSALSSPPSTNWDLLGHEWAVQLLSEHVAHNTARHAYLFSGPQGVGRRTLALRLAQALNCPQPPAPGDACRVCHTCTRIERMQHPDLFVVQSEQISGTLRVDQIRELQHSLSLAPYEARYRLAVLLRFEEANPNAANALLKTLEEPSPQVVLIVTAESGERLLPTIVSRCEVLRLRPLPLATLEEGLQTRWGLPPEQARLLAHLCGGRPGYALRLNQDAEQLARRAAWLDEMTHLLTSNRVARFGYAEALAKDKDKEALRQVLEVWLSFWRDVMLCAANASAPPSNFDRREAIGELAAHLGLEAAHRMVVALERTFDLLDKNVNPRLATEVLMLELPRLSSARIPSGQRGFPPG